MATLSLADDRDVSAKKNARPSVRITRKPPVFVILAGCSACGQIHPVSFRTKKDFLELYCKHTDEPIYPTKKAREKVWREVQHDLMEDAINV